MRGCALCTVMQAEAGEKDIWREYSLARLGLLAATLLTGLLISRHGRNTHQPPKLGELLQAQASRALDTRRVSYPVQPAQEVHNQTGAVHACGALPDGLVQLEEVDVDSDMEQGR